MNLSQIPFQTFSILKAIAYGIDWGFNPTHTQSAIRAAELYINQKTNYPQIEAQIKKNPESLNQFQSVEFEQDMECSWDLKLFQSIYPKNSLGFEYSIFMEKLGYDTLQMNLSDKIPKTIRNILNLGVRNHDLVHFLFQLYDTDSNGKLKITDYHEWVFLFYTIGNVAKDQKFLPSILLFPSLIKATLTGRLKSYNKAKKIGTEMSSAENLNLMWLKPYFDMPVEQVRQELRIKTLSQVNIT
jgi:ubiquinone biosynthesis protein Coq4